MIPFFVADRPLSLRILKGLPLQDYPGVRIGIMAHANTTLNFQNALKQYPCENLDYCDAVDGPCQYRNDIFSCPIRQHILKHTVKMCDSGIFTREGATLSYKELFTAYERMGIEYGIMIDVFGDAQATIEKAKEALEVYEPLKNKVNFKLIGVAQGETVEDYLDCYEQLKQLGFEYIAVGGLLRRTKNTVRYVTVRSQEILFQVLAELRQRYPTDWLFALGCLHPSRLQGLKKLNVWADYKGWIFQYKKRNETLNTHFKNLALNQLYNLDNQETVDCLPSILQSINQRNCLVKEQEKFSKQLHKGRLSLRTALSYLHQELHKETPEIANEFRKLTTYGLLGNREEQLVKSALNSLGKRASKEAEQIQKNIYGNRQISEQIKSLEDQLNQINSSIAKQLDRLTTNSVQFPEDIKESCIKISQFVEITEQAHRLEQVRNQISEKILKPLLALED